MTAEQNRSYFDTIAGQWQEDICESKKNRVAQICDTFLPDLSTPILDVGSGTGILIPFLKYKLPLIELDISRQMLHQAKNEYEDSNSGISLIQADALDSPLIANAIGTIICFQVFPHFDNKADASKEFYRLLKAGGKLFIIHLMDHHKLNALHGSLSDTISDHKMIAAVKLAQLLKSAGFSIKKTIEKTDLYFIEAVKPSSRYPRG